MRPGDSAHYRHGRKTRTAIYVGRTEQGRVHVWRREGTLDGGHETIHGSLLLGCTEIKQSARLARLKAAFKDERGLTNHRRLRILTAIAEAQAEQLALQGMR